MDTNLRDDMKIITLKEHCTAMAPYSLLYNRFHIKQCEIFDACIREEEDAKCRCWLIVRDNTNCTASQMVFNFTKKNHYFNLFFMPEKT